MQPGAGQQPPGRPCRWNHLGTGGQTVRNDRRSSSGHKKITAFPLAPLQTRRRGFAGILSTLHLQVLGFAVIICTMITKKRHLTAFCFSVYSGKADAEEQSIRRDDVQELLSCKRWHAFISEIIRVARNNVVGRYAFADVVLHAVFKIIPLGIKGLCNY